MSANENNVTIRQGIGGVDRPLTYEELDENFRQVKEVIVDTQVLSDDLDDLAFTTNERFTALQDDVDDKYSKALVTDIYHLLDLSKIYLDSLTILPNTLQDQLTISGQNVVIPANTDFYKSTLIVADRQMKFNCVVTGRTAGVVRYKVNAYNSSGSLVTTGTYTQNGTNRTYSQGFNAGDANGDATIIIPSSSIAYVQLEIRTGTTQSNFHSLNVEYTKGWYE